ncbi:MULTISPECIES: histidine kinase [Photorhabdus]|uniref:Two-component system nitrate/nitrite sensor histidine kinase NarX n=2 Tax=Photorhabdus asymbiotica TaxID=291112 RepID=A0ABX9SIQ0_9GAMM|nr:histidine kinase [Photorhabdus asymbiotica]RKS57002.1 two-component system nitrate/nitrite sensor histidine kinase NarX [Photorhabdus asymbiotica]CAQ84641.1 similar to nitrate/nitrite sensor protein narx [Photorhabdus asymbiotica]
MKTSSNNTIFKNQKLFVINSIINLFLLFILLLINKPSIPDLILPLLIMLSITNVYFLIRVVHNSAPVKEWQHSRYKAEINALKQKNSHLDFLCQSHFKIQNCKLLPEKLPEIFSHLNRLIPFCEAKIILYPSQQEYSFRTPHQCPYFDMPLTMRWNLDDNIDNYGTLWIKTHRNSDLTPDEKNLVQDVVALMTSKLFQENQIQCHHQSILAAERASISRELHDSIAQSLSFLKIQVNCLYICSDNLSKQSLASLNMIKDELNIAYRQLRELLAAFRNEQSQCNLQESLQALINEFNHRLGFNIEFNYLLAHQHIPDNYSKHLVQIIRECLNNCYKHSGANWISVRIYPIDDKIIVVVSDNGRGVDLNTINKNKFGLAIIQDRVNIMGGQLQIKNRKQGGTEIEIQFLLD